MLQYFWENPLLKNKKWQWSLEKEKSRLRCKRHKVPIYYVPSIQKLTAALESIHGLDPRARDWSPVPTPIEFQVDVFAPTSKPVGLEASESLWPSNKHCQGVGYCLEAVSCF